MSYVLENLSDETFEKKVDYIYDRLTETLTKVLDEWIDEGIINTFDKEVTLEEWENDRMDLFKSLLG